MQPAVQLALRGTFIDEVRPKPAGSERSRSEPPVALPGSAIFCEEIKYVSTLEARARQHFPHDSLDETDAARKLFSRCSTPGGHSDDSDFTQRPPSCRNKRFTHGSLDSIDDFPAAMEPFSRFSSESTQCPPSRGNKHFTHGSLDSIDDFKHFTHGSLDSIDDFKHFTHGSLDSIDDLPELFSSESTQCTLGDASSAFDDSRLSSNETAADPLFATQCSPPPSKAAVAKRKATVKDQGVATGEWSIGSVGHPGLCNRPCLHFMRGMCAAQKDCRFCHVAHSGGRSPHLDKRHRELLARLSFAQRASVSLPILKRQVAKLGLAARAQKLLGDLGAVARTATWDARTERECASLISALGVLGFRSMLMAISKAPDTPESLRGAALDARLEQIRFAARESGQP